MEASEERTKDPRAVELGRGGGQARARKLSPEQRHRIARRGGAMVRRAMQQAEQALLEAGIRP